MLSRLGALGPIAAAALLVVCCGKTKHDPVPSPATQDAGASGGATTTPGGATGSAFLSGFGCEGVADPQALADATSAACAGLSVECEVLATDLLLLLDRSETMGEPWDGSSRWSIAVDGIAAYLAEQGPPQGAGLQVFGAGGGDEVDCSDETYVFPVVGIDAVDVVSASIAAAALMHPPGGLAALGPALRAALQYADEHVRSHPDRATKVVLLTSGATDACGSTLDALTMAVAGATVDLVVIAIGSDSEAATDLDTLAAPGTKRVFVVEEGGGSERVAEALRGILMGRGARDCGPLELSAAVGVDFDPADTRVFIADAEVPFVESDVACAQSPAGGWYYWKSEGSLQVALCPCTCASSSCDVAINVLAQCDY